MRRQQEVRARGQHRKAHGRELCAGRLARAHRVGNRRAVVLRVRKRRDAHGHGRRAQVKRIECKLDVLQVLHQVRLRNGIANVRAGEIARLAHGVHHDQVAVFAHQRNAALAAVVHVRLVQHHKTLEPRGHDLLDLVPPQRDARRGVWVRQQHVAVGVAQRCNVDAKVVAHGHVFPVEPKGNREVVIEAIRHVRKAHVRARPHKRLHHKAQHLVRAVAHEHLFRVHAIRPRHGTAQRHAVRVGIAAQSLKEPLVTQRVAHARTRRHARLVRIQLHVRAVLRLLAGSVWTRVRKATCKKLAHVNSSSGTRASRARPTQDLRHARPSRTKAPLPRIKVRGRGV